MMSKTTTWFIFSYGWIIMILGYAGYRETGSVVSLWAGLILGGLLVLSSLSMFAKQKVGGYVSLSTTILLTGVFAYRYAITGKAFPAILAVISAGMLLFLLTRIPHWKSH